MNGKIIKIKIPLHYKIKIMVYGTTSHNRTVYAAPACGKAGFTSGKQECLENLLNQYLLGL